MASKDELALLMVMKILHVETTAMMKPFTLKHKFDPVEVRGLIGNFGVTIPVRFDTSIEPKAQYQSHPTSMLRVRFTDAFSLALQSLIIHEATHAFCDKMKFNMDVGQSESMAYIAQCQFAQLRTIVGGNRLTEGDGDGTGDDAVFDVGWRLSGKLLAGTLRDLSPRDISDMRTAVNQHRYYKDKVDLPAVFDGV